MLQLIKSHLGSVEYPQNVTFNGTFCNPFTWHSREKSFQPQRDNLKFQILPRTPSSFWMNQGSMCVTVCSPLFTQLPTDIQRKKGWCPSDSTTCWINQHSLTLHTKWRRAVTSSSKHLSFLVTWPYLGLYICLVSLYLRFSGQLNTAEKGFTNGRKFFINLGLFT